MNICRENISQSSIGLLQPVAVGFRDYSQGSSVTSKENKATQNNTVLNRSGSQFGTLSGHSQSFPTNDVKRGAAGSNTVVSISRYHNTPNAIKVTPGIAVYSSGTLRGDHQKGLQRLQRADIDGKTVETFPNEYYDVVPSLVKDALGELTGYRRYVDSFKNISQSSIGLLQPVAVGFNDYSVNVASLKNG